MTEEEKYIQLKGGISKCFQLLTAVGARKHGLTIGKLYPFHSKYGARLMKICRRKFKIGGFREGLEKCYDDPEFVKDYDHFQQWRDSKYMRGIIEVLMERGLTFTEAHTKALELYDKGWRVD